MPIYTTAVAGDALKDADMLSHIPKLGELRHSLALPDGALGTEPGIKTTLVNIESPKNLEFKNKDSAYFSSLYRLASYYFYNCSMLSMTITRIKTEALRKGLEWVPRFQARCPRCGTAFPKTVSKCSVCEFQGKFQKPDVTQQKTFINWEGGSLITKCNRYGWSLIDLCGSYLTQSLCYNQPLVLCKSVYVADHTGLVRDEIPQEFIPIAPASARMLCDERGNPGDGTGFCIFDRYVKYDMNAKDVKLSSRDPLTGMKLYPARWEISEDLTAQSTGMLYNDNEIFHKCYGLESVNYGLPLSMLVATEIKAWIAASLRIEKYYSTGHPLGILVISGITQDAFATVKRSIELQMKADPYALPMLGIPPAQERASAAKWIPFSDPPTEQTILVMQSLQERISSIFGMSGLFMGDTNSMRGNANEKHQMAIVDRTLLSIRHHVNSMLRWIISKYKTITDWELKLVEPPDDQSRDEEDERNKKYQNALLLKELGFEIISQSDGNIEVSSTPMDYDPIKAITEGILNPAPDKAEDRKSPILSDPGKKFSTDKDDLPSKTFAPDSDVERAVKGFSISADTVAKVIMSIEKAGGRIV